MILDFNWAKFFQGHGSSPASSPELQREPTHQEKIRQLVSYVQSKVEVKKALPEAEEKVYDSETKLSKEKIRQLVSHVQKSTDKKNEKAPPEDEDKHDKSKLTEDEYSKLPELEASILFENQLALSLISKDTKKKGYLYIQFKVYTFRSILDNV